MENPGLYWRYSPIAYVQNIRTPLLIAAARKTCAAPLNEAEHLYGPEADAA